MTGLRSSRAVAAGAVVAAGLLVAGCAPAAGPPQSAPSESAAAPVADLIPAASEQARAFLDEWVQDGRVVRTDEGGDTVSEGQAYGLLAAVIADDEDSFDEIWAWTSAELMRDDGLLAWRWDEGAVVDDEPATDAELDAARALVLAGDRFGRDDLIDDGTTLSTAVLDRLTAVTPLGRVILPGLWAADRDTVPYNPSYASPAAFAVLAEHTGDARWGEVAAGSAAVTAALLDATDLPPDWAQIQPDGRVEAMPGPLGEGLPVQYGYDAARTIVRYAESCTPSDLDLVAPTLSALTYADEPAARLDLGGGALTTDRSALSVVARAAAAGASGDAAAAEADLEAAVALTGEFPTYYGRAWVMLGSAMLTGDALGGCAVIDEVA